MKNCSWNKLFVLLWIQQLVGPKTGLWINFNKTNNWLRHRNHKAMGGKKWWWNFDDYLVWKIVPVVGDVSSKIRKASAISTRIHEGGGEGSPTRETHHWEWTTNTKIGARGTRKASSRWGSGGGRKRESRGRRGRGKHKTNNNITRSLLIFFLRLKYMFGLWNWCQVLF